MSISIHIFCRVKDWVCLLLRLEFWPVRVAFPYPGQEHGGQTGWTGQTGQVSLCRECMGGCSRSSNWEYISKIWSHYDDRDPIVFKKAILSLSHWFCFNLSLTSPHISLLYTAKKAKTGWTSQICQPGSENQPVRPVWPVHKFRP